MAICEGAIDAVTSVYVDSSIYTNGATTALAQADLNLATGAVGQAVWSYLASNFPDQAIGYSGLAVAYQSNYALDSGASPPNHSFEVVRLASFGVGGTQDADPSLVVADFFQNTRYGVPQWPASGLLGSLTQFQNYTLAAGLLISPVIDAQRSASDALTEWLLATNTTTVWSEGVLKFIPYGDTTLTGNGKTYVPANTPVYSLDDDDFLQDSRGSPVLKNDIQDQTDAYNVVQFEYLDRTNQYNMAIALASDAANVEQYGARRKDPDTVHCICDPSVAAISAQLWLQRTLYIRAQYKFKLGWMFALLEPGDIVELTDPGLWLIAYSVRIIQIDEDEKYGLSIIAEDYPIGVAHAPLYQNQPGTGYVVNQSVDPGNASAPVVLNAPPSLTGGSLECWIGASGGPYWGGAQVWLSLDGSSYQYAGVIDGPARYGLTTTTLPIGTDPDTTHSLGVNLSNSNGELMSTTQAGADSGVTLCMVDDELITYETATLTGTNAYTLGTYLRRGVQGTKIAAHAVGAPFVRIDGALFEYPYLAAQANQTIYVKLVSFNIYGQGYQDISTVPVYEIVPAGVPAPALGSWAATGTLIAGETGTAPILSVTGAVDRPGIQSVIVEYRQVIDSTPTYGPWLKDEESNTATNIQINVGAQGNYQVHVLYRLLGGAEDDAEYLDLGTVAIGSALANPLPNIATVTEVYVAGITRLAWPQVTDYRNPDYEVRVGTSWASGLALPRTANPIISTNGDGTYWIAAHYTIPNGGGDIYSGTPIGVTIAGSQLTSNIVATYDEFATGWTGTKTNTTVVTGDLELSSGHSSGTYQVPTGHRINVGRVAACNALMEVGALGVSVTDDVLSLADVLAVADILDSALSIYVTVQPQIRLSQDGTTWGAWQNWSAGAYSAMAFDFQIGLSTVNSTVIPVVTAFTVTVDAPDRLDSYVSQSIAAGGTTLTFSSPFNGGPGGASGANPNIQVSILGATPGDDVLITGVSLSGVTIQVKNGGVGVARTVNVAVQGY